MDIKDKIDVLKFISEEHRSQFNERRKYEWKVVFTSLTFYILCVAAKYGGNFTFPSNLTFKLVVWIMFFTLAIIVADFLSSLHTANNKNNAIAEKAENAMSNMLDGTGEEKISLFPFSYNQISWHVFFKRNIKGIWAWRWQVVILLSFAIASALFLTSEDFEKSFIWILPL